MKHVRGDEPKASAVVNVDRGEGDGPVVVDGAEAGSPKVPELHQPLSERLT
jgi:hypothetical protein